MKSHPSSSSSSKLLKDPINFIKVILSHNIQNTGIMIPEKFTKKHGNDLRERVTLKVPNSDVWQVGLNRSSKGEIWLKNGWREFAERYGLQFGHFLMFNYEGSSIFSVIIFNATASEIVYPVPTKPSFTVKSEEETFSDSLQIIDEGGEECSPKSEVRRSARKAVERVKANFESDEPFFIVYMHKSYIKDKAGPLVPVAFRKKFWSNCKNVKCSLQLVNDGQKTWKIFVHNKLLGYGDWMMFVKDNGIKVGDICAFQLICRSPVVLDVTIFPSSAH